MLTIAPMIPDPSDPHFAGALALRHRLDHERDPDRDPHTAALFQGEMTGSATFGIEMFVAKIDDRVVGLGDVRLNHLATNADQCDVEIEVDPAYRRQGVGRALLGEAIAIAERDGRTTLLAYAVDSAEARGFWASVGVPQKSLERLSRLWLDTTDAALMRRWVDGRAERAGDYELVHLRGETPPEYLAATAALMGAMNDAPTDDLEREPDVWTDEEVLALDRLIIGRGREKWTTLILAPDGQPAGFTAVSIQSEKRRFAHQGNTAVVDEHRGRGLGRWLKADMWLRLRDEAPDVEAIDTDNAASNGPMLDINVAMGFQPLLDFGIWQDETSHVRTALAI